MTENENLKAEIQNFQDAQEFATIRTSCADTPVSDLRSMIKNQTLEPPDLIQIK